MTIDILKNISIQQPKQQKKAGLVVMPITANTLSSSLSPNKWVPTKNLFINGGEGRKLPKWIAVKDILQPSVVNRTRDVVSTGDLNSYGNTLYALQNDISSSVALVPPYQNMDQNYLNGVLNMQNLPVGEKYQNYCNHFNAFSLNNTNTFEKNSISNNSNVSSNKMKNFYYLII